MIIGTIPISNTDRSKTTGSEGIIDASGVMVSTAKIAHIERMKI